MRGVKTGRKGCGDLSHALSRSFYAAPRPTLLGLHHYFPSPPRLFSKSVSKMGSSEQWPAVKVRETFIDYFKKHGHTFGLNLFYD